jgi:class 3 adenylate cyclase
VTSGNAEGRTERPDKEIRKLQRQLKIQERRAGQLEDFVQTKEKLLKGLMTELDEEKKKSEALLRNILPEEIIGRLNSGETLIADRFDDVSVVFSDFQGFTAISSQLEPAILVQSLNTIFSRFDALTQELGVEKIKTIGDAYLAVAGVPTERPDHAVAIADMALGMLEALRDVNRGATTPMRIRIGVATGPVVAGIIGTHKFVYDVWGDTVNVASRLETTSEPDRIQISERTAAGLRDRFVIEGRGEIELKGKGKVPTFFLNGRV